MSGTRPGRCGSVFGSGISSPHTRVAPNRRAPRWERAARARRWARDHPRVRTPPRTPCKPCAWSPRGGPSFRRRRRRGRRAPPRCRPLCSVPSRPCPSHPRTTPSPDLSCLLPSKFLHLYVRTRLNRHLRRGRVLPRAAPALVVVATAQSLAQRRYPPSQRRVDRGASFDRAHDHLDAAVAEKVE